MKPVRLQPNLIEHFYAGGARIAELRGIETSSERQPEEWIAATVSRAGEPGVGPSRTTEGDLLRDLVAADPRAWTGSDVPDGDTGLLVKLLDAGQRLPVHVHPDRAFATHHLDCPYGKSEAWYVLAVDDGAAVHLGWTEDVDPDELARRRDDQDGAWMLDHLHRVEVLPGDGVFVPAGLPHSIGAGVFVAEIQEPTDFSILLEWSVTTSGRDDSHLDLGFEVAMGAVRHRSTTAGELDRLVRRAAEVAPGVHSVLPAEADEFFRLDLAVAESTGTAEVPAGFAAVVVIDGNGELETAESTEQVTRGDVLAMPAAAGDWTMRGDLRMLVARAAQNWEETHD
ncbi:class I mannose-6-phosphate isomerase [Aeromicrobium sp.]|uniref:class I mannose-6-phosphate isomerase n=1 Tax=Aeromicrobium sp. TaxID=1871063 RepID=UPI003C36942B